MVYDGSTLYIEGVLFIMQKNIQDLFLSRLRRSQAAVTMFLMNGFQLRGTIAGFDQFVVVLMSDQKQQVIYKHAISTITPERPISLEEVSAD